MAEIKKSNEAKDYKERFEFRLTVGNNIICQRYFKINSFNVTSLRSYELMYALRQCAYKIDRDLIDKTQVYLSIVTPRIFNSKEEMDAYFQSEYNRGAMSLGEGIVVIGDDKNYFWDGNEPKVCSYKFDEGEFTRELTDEDMVEYKLSFLVDGKEACSTIWTGVYPKYIRNSIDLSNKRGRLEDGEDGYGMSFEQYLMYRLVKGRKDLVWVIIKELSSVCSMSNEDKLDYTIEERYGKKTYKNILSRDFR